MLVRSFLLELDCHVVPAHPPILFIGSESPLGLSYNKINHLYDLSGVWAPRDATCVQLEEIQKPKNEGKKKRGKKTTQERKRTPPHGKNRKTSLNLRDSSLLELRRRTYPRN